MLRKFKVIIAMLGFVAFVFAENSFSAGTDSRIRTFVYGENDVYRVTTTYGFHTVIEFEKDEKIITVSLGNSGAFKITPKVNKIFVKTAREGLVTNMIVFTNKRSYQFELSSDLVDDSELMYVAKFYYPDENSTEVSSPMARPVMGNDFSINVPRVSVAQAPQNTQYTTGDMSMSVPSASMSVQPMPPSNVINLDEKAGYTSSDSADNMNKAVPASFNYRSNNNVPSRM